MFYIDYYYFILVMPTMLLPPLTQGLVQLVFRKYSSVQTGAGILGKEIAERLLYLVTFSVEIDASRRALKMLRITNLFSDDELSGLRYVLTAAAFTYVASALTAIASLIRLILLSIKRR